MKRKTPGDKVNARPTLTNADMQTMEFEFKRSIAAQAPAESTLNRVKSKKLDGSYFDAYRRHLVDGFNYETVGKEVRMRENVKPYDPNYFKFWFRDKYRHRANRLNLESDPNKYNWRFQLLNNVQEEHIPSPLRVTVTPPVPEHDISSYKAFDESSNLKFGDEFKIGSYSVYKAIVEKEMLTGRQMYPEPAQPAGPAEPELPMIGGLNAINFISDNLEALSYGSLALVAATKMAYDYYFPDDTSVDVDYQGELFHGHPKFTHEGGLTGLIGDTGQQESTEPSAGEAPDLSSFPGFSTQQILVDKPEEKAKPTATKKPVKMRSMAHIFIEKFVKPPPWARARKYKSKMKKVVKKPRVNYKELVEQKKKMRRKH